MEIERQSTDNKHTMGPQAKGEPAAFRPALLPVGNKGKAKEASPTVMDNTNLEPDPIDLLFQNLRLAKTKPWKIGNKRPIEILRDFSNCESSHPFSDDKWLEYQALKFNAFASLKGSDPM